MTPPHRTIKEGLASLGSRKQIVRSIVQPVHVGKRHQTMSAMFKRLRPGLDGRVHTGLSVATTSMRLASSDTITEGDEEDGERYGSTNLQNLSNKIAILDPLYDARAVMCADPGFRLVSRDYAGAEMLLCVDAESLTLMADLTWRPLKEVKVGDKILTPTENPVGKGPGYNRQWRVATVTATRKSYREIWSFCTPYGTLRVTPDHKVLRSKAHGWDWLEAQYLVSGRSRQSNLAFAASPWEPADSYLAGWLGGFFDGEGYLSWIRGNFGVRGSQNPGPVLEQAKDFLRAMHFNTTEYRSRSSSVRNLYVNGKFAEQLRLLGLTRPVRLLQHLTKNLSTKRLNPAALLQRAPITRIRSLGKRLTIDLTTTEGTFLADGFVVHNCFMYAEDWLWVDRMLAGESAHAYHAIEAFGLRCPWQEVKKKHKEVYTTSKNLGFLSIYMGSVRTAVVTFNKDYAIHGQRTTEKEVQKFQDMMHALHPLKAWWAEVERGIRLSNGIVTNALGYARPLRDPDEHNRLKDALSFFPQSTVGVLMNQVVCDVLDNLDRQGEIEVLHQNHDELDWESTPECLEESLKYTKKSMERPFTIHGRKVYIPTEAKISKLGGSWGDMEEVKGA